MKTIITTTIMVLVCISHFGYSQTGINTTNPQGVFNVDGNGDNGSLGTTVSGTSKESNDFVVSDSGRVGIGVVSPDASARLEIKSTTQGFLPPRLTSAEASVLKAKATVGLMIYNTTEKCLQIFTGSDFICLADRTPSYQDSLNDNGVNFGGKAYEYYTLSVYDDNYFPYTIPTGVATASTGVDPDVTTESTVLDIQGQLTTTGVTIPVYYYASSPGTVAAFSQTVNVPAAYTEDGISRDVNLSFDTFSVVIGENAFITATLKAVGGTLNVKKLDLNAGVGANSKGLLLAYFDNFPGTFEYRAVPGIPDREFGKGNNHDFIYSTVSVMGELWLNNNLGANYANIHRAAFSPASQATTYNDTNAHGSHYQWGRYSDGHELTLYTSTSAGAPVNGVYGSRYANIAAYDADTSANKTKFIWFSTVGNDWLTTSNDNLWQGMHGKNNPCPPGFRLPNSEDYFLLGKKYKANYSLSATMDGSPLKLSTAGYNTAGSSLSNLHNLPCYWTSYRDIGGSGTTLSKALRTLNNFFTTEISTGGANTRRREGLSVRCIRGY